MLVPCPACARHLRTTESTCPFCRASRQARPAPEPTRGAPLRLSRAALALAGMTALTACGKSADVQAPAYGGPPPLANTEEPPRAAYGGPPATLVDAAPPEPPAVDAGKDAGKAPAPKPTPNIVSPPAPAYGGPPPKR